MPTIQSPRTQLLDREPGRSRKRSEALALAALIFAFAFPPPASAAPFRPERLQLDLDEWIPGERFSLSLVQRTRFEALNDQFRRGQSGDDALVAMRTLLHARFRPSETFGLRFGAELQDSRAYESGGTTLTTTTVNAAELLQAYAEYQVEDVRGGRLLARGGRITMDVGSRRFVARNRFRNTINGFTGIDLRWQSPTDSHAELRGFWTLPVDRRPRNGVASQARLRRNEVEFDEESFDVQFWGLFAARDVPGDARLELFSFGLHESDSRERPSANRKLYTHGFRLLREPAAGRFDLQLEGALQHGRSRASAATANTANLDHLAHFEHAQFGYTFDAPWSPRLALQFDHASGDAKPGDDDNGRFDTLFGARRFEFGPTGIYGPFARSNLLTPGGRLQLKPCKDVSAFVAYRAYWLAEKRDAWTTSSGLRDAAGNSGRFVGHQLEFRVRWHLLPQHALLEAGYAHLFDGEFIRKAPNSSRQGDSNYAYTQLTLSF